MKSLSHVRLFATPWTVACQPPSSMGFSRQEHWSGLTFPSPDMRKASQTEWIYTCITESGLPRWLSGKESAYQCRRHKRYGYDPWVEKIPWKVPWTEEPGWLESMRLQSWPGLSRGTCRHTELNRCAIYLKLIQHCKSTMLLLLLSGPVVPNSMDSMDCGTPGLPVS